jgi:geranylgeranyl diphosphate synthase type II
MSLKTAGLSSSFAEQVEKDIERLLPMVEGALSLPFAEGEALGLLEAMRYSLGAGGKRIRPLLCLLAAESVGGEAGAALPCAVSLEYIHTYSLIHDDLPAMDDDDLRRGRPTNHKVYGEGQAILAGDALLTEAFFVLAKENGLPPAKKSEAAFVLAEAAGHRGMAGGQSLDLEGEAIVRGGAPYDLEHLRLIHRLKTGALLRASLEMGGVAAGASQEHRAALRGAGAALGMAFQIMDDILDATSTADAMGKRVGKDAEKGKITYIRLLGLEGARESLGEATERAVSLLSVLPEPAALMAWARYLASRAN